jgi:hypothetical protein
MNNKAIHWQRIEQLLPKIEAAAYRRYPHSVSEFIAEGIDALLALPLAEIDPDSPQSHTDSYLVQRAVFAGQRKLWQQYSSEWQFADLVDAEVDEEWQLQFPDTSHDQDEAESDLAETIEEVAQQFTAQELELFQILRQAIASDDADLFFQNGKLRQAVLVGRGGFSRSGLSRAVNGLRDKLGPLAVGRALAA